MHIYTFFFWLFYKSLKSDAWDWCRFRLYTRMYKHYCCRDNNTEILRFFINSIFFSFLLYHPYTRGCHVKTLLKQKKCRPRLTCESKNKTFSQNRVYNNYNIHICVCNARVYFCYDYFSFVGRHAHVKSCFNVKINKASCHWAG